MPPRDDGSLPLLDVHFRLMTILGADHCLAKTNRSYFIYSLAATALITIWYPTHLLLMILRSPTMAENLKNLSIGLTCLACSLKFVVFHRKMSRVPELQRILEQLDSRVKSDEEWRRFVRMKHDVRLVMTIIKNFWFLLAGMVSLFCFINPERLLLYPGWFPFDWRRSSILYWMATLYQLIGILWHLARNFVNDGFPPMALCLLSHHVDILHVRVAGIGHDNGGRRLSVEECEKEMNQCIRDHMILYRLFDCIEDIISWPVFFQLAVTALNTCLAIVGVMFFLDNFLERAYFGGYAFGLLLEIFPVCYYGSELTERYDHLHEAAFNSSWTTQSRRYKKHMILFTERSLKTMTPQAGGLVQITLDTFLSTCRAAYSIFAVIMNMERV